MSRAAGSFLASAAAGTRTRSRAHGTVFKTRFKKMREQIEAMKEIWTKPEREYQGEIVAVPKMRTSPKPVQKPHPPVIVGGAFPHSARRAIRYADGWVPNASRPQYADVTEFLPKFRQMATEAGRDPATVPVSIFGAPEDLDRLKRYRDQGIARVVVSLPSAKADEILPVLDRWAGLIRQAAH
jgi:alkanesulfonate monooxygenase SsuD/methylene tetrahydromethanopterin reductase-like flavin-dependent oxidoreductase (luciferase family)